MTLIVTDLLKPFVKQMRSALIKHCSDKGDLVPPLGQLRYYQGKIIEHLINGEPKDYVDIANYAVLACNELTNVTTSTTSNNQRKVQPCPYCEKGEMNYVKTIIQDLVQCTKCGAQKYDNRKEEGAGK